MREAARKAGQVLAVWAVVLCVIWPFWPGAVGISQLWVTVLVSILANVLQPAYKLGEGSRNNLDRGTARQIVWTVYASQLLAIAELCARGRPEIEWDLLSYGALLCMLAGLALRTWAVRTLRRFFTWNIEVQRDQHLIEDGPYRFVRHPSYTGAWLTYVGSCILLRSWLAAGIAAVTLTLAFLRRARYEEQALDANVPGYREYSRRTARFVPWLF